MREKRSNWGTQAQTGDDNDGGYEQFKTDTNRIVDGLKRSGASQEEINDIVKSREDEFRKSQ